MKKLIELLNEGWHVVKTGKTPEGIEIVILMKTVATGVVTGVLINDTNGNVNFII